MRRTILLDCTLRDGGYINDWNFGESAIKGTIRKLSQTGIGMIEIGFIKGDKYDPNISIFPDTNSFKNVLINKDPNVDYVGMIDISDPVSLDKILPYDGKSIDGIRVIFKKNKIQEGYEYCKALLERGYKVFANFVSTDAYSDKEFIETIELFNNIHPTGITIVDTFGMMKKKMLSRLINIADNNLDDGIMLCYHAHNNLQQAMGNAESMVEMNLHRDIIIDACVFGMGRGAGNLNLELFAEFMNENYGTSYKIEPMLEIMDEYLSDFYRTKFWGYSLPLYLSASFGYHPNYAIYLAEKNTLPVKSFHDLLLTIPQENKYVFSEEIAEHYYREYFKAYIDDSAVLKQLSNEFKDKKIIVIAPGKSILDYKDTIQNEISKDGTLVISINFYDKEFQPNYIFSSNLRRYLEVENRDRAKLIATSNISSKVNADYIINFLSYTGDDKEIFDNAGLMLLRLLVRLNVKEVMIAGMDGYSDVFGDNFFDSKFEASHLSVANTRNILISSALQSIESNINLTFITPTRYNV